MVFFGETQLLQCTDQPNRLPDAAGLYQPVDAAAALASEGAAMPLNAADANAATGAATLALA